MKAGLIPDILIPIRPAPDHPWNDGPGIDEPILPEDPGETPEEGSR